jgi:hypothetical protein
MALERWPGQSPTGFATKRKFSVRGDRAHRQAKKNKIKTSVHFAGHLLDATMRVSGRSPAKVGSQAESPATRKVRSTMARLSEIALKDTTITAAFRDLAESVCRRLNDLARESSGLRLRTMMEHWQEGDVSTYQCWSRWLHEVVPGEYAVYQTQPDRAVLQSSRDAVVIELDSRWQRTLELLRQAL